MAAALDLSRFECRRCGACCRIKDGIVRLSDAEIRRIADFLGMSEEDFIENETVLSPDRRCLVLKDGPDGGCAMLDERGLCRIHAVKPDKCRTFPYEWTNATSAEYCEGLKKIIGIR
jgi:Fe-S-cluster containining protein